MHLDAIAHIPLSLMNINHWKLKDTRTMMFYISVSMFDICNVELLEGRGRMNQVVQL
jgi:hypothetical protein